MLNQGFQRRLEPETATVIPPGRLVQFLAERSYPELNLNG